MYQKLEQDYKDAIEYLYKPKTGLVLNLRAYRLKRKIMDMLTTIAAYACCIMLAILVVFIIYGFYLILP